MTRFHVGEEVVARVEVAPRTHVEVTTTIAEIFTFEKTGEPPMYSVWYAYDGYPVKSGWIFERDIHAVRQETL